jgi:hypothetical protein
MQVYVLTVTLRYRLHCVNTSLNYCVHCVSQQVQSKSSGAPVISAEWLQAQQLHLQQQQQPLEAQALQKEQLQALGGDAPLSPDRASSASSTAAAAADSEDSGMDFDFDELLTGDVDAKGFENASAGGASAVLLADGGRLSPTPLPTAVLTPSALSALTHSTTTALVPLVSGSLYPAQVPMSGALYSTTASSSEQGTVASVQRANGSKKSILKRTSVSRKQGGKAVKEPVPAAATVPTSKVMLAVMGHGDGKMPHSSAYAGSSSTASSGVRQTKVAIDHARAVAVLLLVVVMSMYVCLCMPRNAMPSPTIWSSERAYAALQMHCCPAVMLV